MKGKVWWRVAGAAVVALPVATIGAAACPARSQRLQAGPRGRRPERNRTDAGPELGPVRLTRSLWPTIEVNDVTLANLAMAAPVPTWHGPNGSRCGCRCPALLQRQIEVARLTLIGPNILFEQVGRASNWVFGARAGPARAALPPPRAHLPTRGDRTRSAHVQNGMVTWHLPARTKVVGIRSLDLRRDTDQGPLDVDAVLVYSDNQPFTMRASATPTAGIAGPWSTRLDFAAFDTAAAATGTMDIAGHYDLQVEARRRTVRPRRPARQLGCCWSGQGEPSAHGAERAGAGRPAGDRRHSAEVRRRRLRSSRPGAEAWRDAGVVGACRRTGGHIRTWLVRRAAIHAGRHGRRAQRSGWPCQRARRSQVPGCATGGKHATGNLALKGKLALNALGFEGLDVAAVLHTQSLAALRPVLAQGLPALTAVEFEGHLAIPANAAVVRFKDAKLKSHQGDVAGEGALGLGGTLLLDARLQSHALDLGAMLEAFGVHAAVPAARANRTGPMIPDTPLPWELLHGPSLDITASVGAMTFQDEVWQAVELALRVKGGRLQVGTVKLALPAGPAAVSLTADASASPVPVSLSVHAPSIPLALLARYASIPGQVSGTARIEAQPAWQRPHGAGPGSLAGRPDLGDGGRGADEQRSLHPADVRLAGSTRHQGSGAR